MEMEEEDVARRTLRILNGADVDTLPEQPTPDAA